MKHYIYTKILQILLLLLFLTWQVNLANSQPIDEELNQKFSTKELKEDFKILRENLEKLHIGLYSYTSKNELDKTFEKIEGELNKPLTALEFFREIVMLNKPIGNGHTSFSPPKTILKALRTKLPMFPLEVYYTNGSLYVLNNLSSNSSIKEGSEILTINGTPTKTLFGEMAEKIKRDGYNTTYPEKRLSTYFAIHLAVLNGVSQSYKIELKEPSGKRRMLDIRGLSTSKIEENRLSRYKKRKFVWDDSKTDPAFALSINGDVARMKVRTFQKHLIKKKGQNSKKFFKKSFKRIKKAKVNHLIIDLRDNNGGQPSTSVALLKHLLDKPFTLYKSINTNVAKIPDFPYFIKDGSIKYFESIGWVKKEKLFELEDQGEFKLTKTSKKPYAGKIYVLINAFSTSATGTFIGQLKAHTKAIFIGEENGGNPNQTVARQVIALNLPNSKIKVTIPLVLSVKNVNFKNTGRGIIPDHKIKPTIKDILSEKDVVMNFTLRLIKSKN